VNDPVAGEASDDLDSEVEDSEVSEAETVPQPALALGKRKSIEE
jgi:hypothetical protein